MQIVDTHVLLEMVDSTLARTNAVTESDAGAGNPSWRQLTLVSGRVAR